MIISNKVLVKSSQKYFDLGYDINDRYILVDIKDVPKNSSALINVSCDYCNESKEISYKNYNKNISSGGKFACSVRCGVLKSKESTFKKWGVDSTNKLSGKKEKIKKTLMLNWGVDHVSRISEVSQSKSNKMKEKSEEVSKRIKDFYSGLDKEDIEKINQKRCETSLKKWGVDNVSKLDFVKLKVKKTFNEKWGGFTLSSDFLRKKVKDTNIEKWGYEHPSKSEIIKDKTYKTNYDRWGVKIPSMNQLIKDKMKDTMMGKYDVVNIMFSEDFRKKYNITNELGYSKYLGDRLYEFICGSCNKEYIIDYDNYYKRKLRFVNTCTNCFPILSTSSIKEDEIYAFIKSIYSGNIIKNYRDGLEIDIFIPELNLGFEFNGIYWHNDDKLDKNYHLNKTNYFNNKGISIIHIWEDDWDFKKDIIKSQISNFLKLSNNKIFARNCEIREIEDSKLVRKFLDKNHIQGFIRSLVKLGLYHNNELISIMTFDQSEGRKKMDEREWNLSRFCSKLDCNVLGASSKLLKYFIRKWKPKRIISFADKDWSKGDLYFKLGFTLKNELKPDFKYIIDNKRINKQRLTKKKLIKMGKNPNLTSERIINEMNIKKIYGVGQLKFEMILI